MLPFEQERTFRQGGRWNGWGIVWVVLRSLNYARAMKRIIVTYGLIGGAIVVLSFVAGQLALSMEGVSNFSEVLGYLVMIIALSLIFIGVKRYRDEYLGGVIRFGTALRVGLGIALVASFIYVIGWEVNLALTDYRFIEEYTAHLLEQKEAEGMSGAALGSEVAKMERMKEQYSNVFYRVPLTFIEIFPVGLLISLLSAGLLKNSKFLAAA